MNINKNKIIIKTFNHNNKKISITISYKPSFNNKMDKSNLKKMKNIIK